MCVEVDRINEEIRDIKKQGISVKEVSDGWHTFSELYDFRKLYNAHLFNEWALSGKYEVYKSKKHYDGEVCFDGDMFIVVAILPEGQISNHYKLKDWDLFEIPEYEKSKYEYDGHTPEDVLERLENNIKVKKLKA